MTGNDKVETVAADTNIIRQVTPRRYLTVLEGLRGRSIAILPMVDEELRRELRTQAGDHIRDKCRSANIKSLEVIDAAAVAAGLMAGEWWAEERKRNDSTYIYLPDRGERRYSVCATRLPKAAFDETNNNDLWIYAQAWAHDIDVLASRNRNTISKPELKRHFALRGFASPPISIRGLYEHTAVIAETENRDIADVALEAVLGAVIPEAWNSGKTDKVRQSCGYFATALSLSERREASIASEENHLVNAVRRGLKASGPPEFTRLCEKAYATRPHIARETEARYQNRRKALMQEFEIELGW